MQRVIPTILTGDPAELREKLALLREQTKWVQIDIMDGKFVSNTSINLFELGDAYQYFNLEIHLMVSHPEKYFEDCREIGAKRVVVHLEALEQPEAILREMTEKYQFQRALAVNPSTPSGEIASIFPMVHSVLVLSVNPGFQGQEFISSMFGKIGEIKSMSPQAFVGVDGGVNEKNILQIFRAGADYVTVGSAIWKAEDPIEALRHLEGMVQEVHE